jgi:hypothetical protein
MLGILLAKRSKFSILFLNKLYARKQARAGSEGYIVDIAERRVHNIFNCETLNSIMVMLLPTDPCIRINPALF